MSAARGSRNVFSPLVLFPRDSKVGCLLSCRRLIIFFGSNKYDKLHGPKGFITFANRQSSPSAVLLGSGDNDRIRVVFNRSRTKGGALSDVTSVRVRAYAAFARSFDLTTVHR